MTINIEELRKDMEAGTQGDWRFEEYENAISEKGVRVAYGEDDWNIICDNEPYYPQGVTPENARRIARLPELEREYIALREAADAILAKLDPDALIVAALEAAAKLFIGEDWVSKSNNDALLETARSPEAIAAIKAKAGWSE